MDQEEVKSIRTLFQQATDPASLQAAIADEVLALSNYYLDNFFLKFEKSARKTMTEFSRNVAQKVLDPWLKIVQLSDSSPEAANLLRAYTDVVNFNTPLETAATDSSACLEDLKWLVLMRPPEKANKENFKPGHSLKKLREAKLGKV